MPSLFTIGHSSHTLDTFLEHLHLHDVEVVVDVRSHPYSRRHPQYRRVALRGALEQARIDYAFLGRELGARTEDPACYANGRVDYARLAQTDAFQRGLDLLAAQAAMRRVVLMCAEKDPLTCHRAILVCRGLETRTAGRAERIAAPMRTWAIQHIHADGRLERHEAAEARLLGELGIAPDLFRGADEAVAEAYRQRAAQIAWVKP